MNTPGSEVRAVGLQQLDTLCEPHGGRHMHRTGCVCVCREREKVCVLNKVCKIINSVIHTYRFYCEEMKPIDTLC